MAISNSFFGLRRGSTKSHTYSIFNGKQVTKDRVSDVKNPRTAAQMSQRMMLTTIGALYKLMRPIADHSWENKSYGLQSMNYFMSTNLKALQGAAQATPQIWNLNAFGNSNARPNPVKISEGTLDSLGISLAGLGAATFGISLYVGTESPTVANIISYLGVKPGDLITFVGIAVNKDATGSFGGLVQPDNSKLAILRLYMPLGQSDTVVTADNFAEVFAVEAVNTDYTANVEAGGGVSVNINTGAYRTVIDAGAVILSRKTDTVWARSTEYLTLSQNAIAGSYAEVLATYPISQEYILNGGDF